MMEKIWPILLQTSIIWVPLLFMVRREYKRAKRERDDLRAEERKRDVERKSLEVQKMIQDYGDAVKRQREREEQQHQMAEIADMVAARLEQSEKERQLQEVVDRASAHAEPER